MRYPDAVEHLIRMPDLAGRTNWPAGRSSALSYLGNVERMSGSASAANPATMPARVLPVTEHTMIVSKKR